MKLILTILSIALELIPAGRMTAQTFTNLHDFSALVSNTNSDGAEPDGDLVLSAGALYGVAGEGGNSGAGTVFAINIDGAGFRTLHAFTVGGIPKGLVVSGSTLIGTTLLGNSDGGSGSVFAVKTNGTGFTNLHSFTALKFDTALYFPIGTNNDGSSPGDGLILSSDTVFGTTGQGGFSGNGTVFAINTDGTGFRTLHSFTELDPTYGTNSDGAGPGGLILSGDTLYGSTWGGAVQVPAQYSQLKPMGQVSWIYTISAQTFLAHRKPLI